MAQKYAGAIHQAKPLRQGLVRFARSISELSAQSRIQPESWFASRCSLQESVAHCWHRRSKRRPRRVTQRTEALLCEGLLRDSPPLHEVFFVSPGIRWVSCTTLFHSCNEG